MQKNHHVSALNMPQISISALNYINNSWLVPCNQMAYKNQSVSFFGVWGRSPVVVRVCILQPAQGYCCDCWVTSQSLLIFLTPSLLFRGLSSVLTPSLPSLFIQYGTMTAQVTFQIFFVKGGLTEILGWSVLSYDLSSLLHCRDKI